jgi:hypothetical protein
MGAKPPRRSVPEAGRCWAATPETMGGLQRVSWLFEPSHGSWEWLRAMPGNVWSELVTQTACFILVGADTEGLSGIDLILAYAS